jgi:hypothetical protein
MVVTCSSSHKIFQIRALSQDLMAHFKVVKMFEVKRFIKVLKWMEKFDVPSCWKILVLRIFSKCFVCDKLQFWWPVLGMIQIDSAQVFNIKVIACHFLFPLLPRTWILIVWVASVEERKLGIHTWIIGHSKNSSSWRCICLTITSYSSHQILQTRQDGMAYFKMV